MYVSLGTFLLTISKMTHIFMFHCSLFAWMLSIIPICEYTSIDLPIFMLMGIQIESILLLLLWTRLLKA